MSRSTTWIDESRAAVDRASNQVQAHSELEALEEAETDLHRALRELSDLCAAASLGQRTWWPGFDASPDIWTGLDAARENPGRRSLQSVTRKLTDYRKDVRSAVQTAWREHIASRAGDAGDLRELMRVLSGTGGLAEISRRLDEALGGLVRLQKTLPDAQAVQTLDDVVDLLETLEAELPAAVKAFVSAASRGGAALDLLDANVRGWLADNGAVNSFKIVPGRPQEARRG